MIYRIQAYTRGRWETIGTDCFSMGEANAAARMFGLSRGEWRVLPVEC